MLHPIKSKTNKSKSWQDAQVDIYDKFDLREIAEDNVDHNFTICPLFINYSEQ